MTKLEQEEQEYISFILKLTNKANEFTKDYNKLSDKNKYRVQLFFKEIVHKSSLIRILLK